MKNKLLKLICILSIIPFITVGCNFTNDGKSKEEIEQITNEVLEDFDDEIKDKFENDSESNIRLIKLPAASVNLKSGEKITKDKITYVDVALKNISNSAVLTESGVIGLCVADGVTVKANHYFEVTDLVDCE